MCINKTMMPTCEAQFTVGQRQKQEGQLGDVCNSPSEEVGNLGYASNRDGEDN